MLLACSFLAASLLRAAPIFVLDPKGLTVGEVVLAQTLQGKCANEGKLVWLKTDGVQAKILADLHREGHPLVDAETVLGLAQKFHTEFKGYIRYRKGNQSLNVACSLCGPMEALAADETLADTLKAKGFKQLLDVSEMTERDAFDKYKALFRNGYAFEQTVDKPGALRDFIVAHRGFVMDTRNRAFRRAVVVNAGPRPLVFGWGPDEYEWVTQISAAGGTAVAADWCMNLSVLEKLPVSIPSPPKQPRLRLHAGKRYVAFVLSDGDNVQWQTGGFATDPKFFGNKLRGGFPMTWEVSPLLAFYAPRVLRYIYANATPLDGFVTGAGLPGYMYPHVSPDPGSLASDSVPSMKAAHLHVASFLNQNQGRMAEVAPWLTFGQVSGGIYKDYSPYNRRQGELEWFHNKPCLAYKFVLWDGLMEPDPLAKAIESLPKDPLHNDQSFALINVHAWSFEKTGGPLQAVQEVLKHLSPDTVVVNADQLLDLVSLARRERSR